MVVDLFLNQTNFSCSDKASRNLLSSPVELGQHIGLSPLVTWVSVLVQAKLSHLDGHLSVHIPKLSHRYAMAEFEEGPRLDRGRAEPGFKCFGVIV